MTLSKKRRESLRMMFGGRCAYCGIDLAEKGWHADHIEPVVRDWKFVKDEYGHIKTNENGHAITRATGRLFRPHNDRSDNLYPACRACNIDKGCSGLEDWRYGLQHKIKVLRDNSSAFRHAERFGLISVVNESIIFWFEKYMAIPEA